MSQRAMRGGWTAQVAAETPESAHTWRWHRSQTRLGCRLAFQVAAEMPEQAHTWRGRTSAMSPGGSVTAVHTAPYRIRTPVVRDAPAEPCGTENGACVKVGITPPSPARSSYGTSRRKHNHRYRAPLRRLQSRQRSWQLEATVRPPSLHGVMWSASISRISIISP